MNDNRSGQKQWEIMLPRFHELAKGGASSRIIADALSVEFGFTITRNSVVGKLHREGYRPSGVVPHGPPKGTKTKFRKKALPKEEYQMPYRQQGVYITDLQPHHCRWIEGPASSLFYCGADNGGLSAWCPTHFKIAYAKRS